VRGWGAFSLAPSVSIWRSGHSSCTEYSAFPSLCTEYVLYLQCIPDCGRITESIRFWPCQTQQRQDRDNGTVAVPTAVLVGPEVVTPYGPREDAAPRIRDRPVPIAINHD
jgi:hypothetical protein